MTQTRMMALCVVAVFAFSAVAVPSASAESPEFQTKNKKTGEWEPLRKHVKFTETSGAVTLRSAASELSCATSSGKGSLTGPKTLTFKTTYTSCEDPVSKATCQSGKKAGAIKTGKMEGTLVYASANPGEPLVVAVSGPVIGSYRCGTTKFTSKGVALGALTPTLESTSTLDVAYGELAEREPGCGRQELQLIQGLAPCVHLEVQGGLGPEESAWVVGKKKEPVTKETVLSGNVTLVK
jgi:hypothetical protein